MSTSPECVVAAPRRLPGDLAMWLFIAAELAVFGILILAFVVSERLDPALFARGRAALDASLGVLLTLSLLSSGLLAALAVEGAREGQSRRAALLLLGALGSAAVYVLLKLREYGHLLAQGLDVEHDNFFALYWILTGFHFVHVLLGLVILGWLALRSWRRVGGAGEVDTLESGVLYWHMVDLVWVMLFPVVYLAG